MKALLAACALLLVGTYGTAYRRYARKLLSAERRSAREKVYDDRQSELVNSIGPYRGLTAPSHWTHLDRRKPTGAIRVGVFGASINVGTRLRPGLDFPTLLALELGRRGLENVQVINFPADNLHLAARLWERFAVSYGLDFILLGPDLVRADWNETFNRDRAAGVIHGRYILRDGDAVFHRPGRRAERTRAGASLLSPDTAVAVSALRAGGARLPAMFASGRPRPGEPILLPARARPTGRKFHAKPGPDRADGPLWQPGRAPLLQRADRAFFAHRLLLGGARAARR